MSYDNVPEYLKQFDHWLLWRKDKTPVNCNNITIDPTNPANLVSFACAVECAHHFAGIGYSFQPIDGCTGIDLDDAYKKKPDGSYAYADPAKEQARQKLIYERFDSYSELSPSGKGVHIIVKGEINGGAKPSWTPVEIYDRQRFFTVTGNVIDDRTTINEVDAVALTMLYEQLRPAAKSITTVGIDREATKSDADIIALATEYNQGFAPLMAGSLLHHSSASEACVHLMNIIGSFTQNRDQCRRLFAMSPLGSRPKVANRPGLVEDWIDMSFDKLPPPIDFSAMQAAWQSGVSEADGDTTPTPKSAPEGAAQPTNAALPVVPKPSQSVYTFPPGLLGDIARFIYAQSPRPVPEISLAGAIGFMAGICGQQYNISGEGLNYYILVLARSGRGKEAMRQGINKIVKAADASNHGAPLAAKFIGPGDMASSIGLVRHLGKEHASHSIVSVLGEFGLKLQQLADPRANGTEKLLQKLILEIYHMSGPAGILMPTVYADVTKTTDAINSPAFSIIAETSFERFRVDETIINDGLIPRFSIIEYKGPLVPFNENCFKVEVPVTIVQEVQSLCANSLTRQRDTASQEVAITDEAKLLFNELLVWVDAKVNRDDVKEAYTNIWNRTHIRAMKLAALVAVGINKYNPSVDANCAQWAIDFVKNDGRILHEGLEGGGIGHFATDSVESECLNELTKQIAKYIIEPFKPSTNKAAIAEEHGAGIFRASYIQAFITKNKRFQDRDGKTTRALYETLQTLCDYGYIELLPQNKAKTYRIIDRSFFTLAYEKYTKGKA